MTYAGVTDPENGGKYLFELVDRARPARLEQARERAVGEDLAAGLAARAVVGLVVRVDDTLDRRAAHRAGFAKSSVHRHDLAKGGDFLRKIRARLLAQPLGPSGERCPRRIAESLHLGPGKRLNLRERGELRPVQDLVRIGVADSAEQARVGEGALQRVVLSLQPRGKLLKAG